MKQWDKGLHDLFNGFIGNILSAIKWYKKVVSSIANKPLKIFYRNLWYLVFSHTLNSIETSSSVLTVISGLFDRSLIKSTAVVTSSSKNPRSRIQSSLNIFPTYRLPWSWNSTTTTSFLLNLSSVATSLFQQLQQNSQQEFPLLWQFSGVNSSIFISHFCKPINQTKINIVWKDILSDSLSDIWIYFILIKDSCFVIFLNTSRKYQFPNFYIRIFSFKYFAVPEMVHSSPSYNKMCYFAFCSQISGPVCS